MINKIDIEKALKNPSNGLPQSVFGFISSITPMVNVDLLVQDCRGRVLLAWRHDRNGDGWHIPGGIVRFKESFEERLKKTALKELHTEITFNPEPIKISEIFMDQQYRGHFISFLYRCYLPEGYEIDNGELATDDDGYLKWHESNIDNIVKGQEVYKTLLNDLLDKSGR